MANKELLRALHQHLREHGFNAYLSVTAGGLLLLIPTVDFYNRRKFTKCITLKLKPARDPVSLKIMKRRSQIADKRILLDDPAFTHKLHDHLMKLGACTYREYTIFPRESNVNSN